MKSSPRKLLCSMLSIVFELAILTSLTSAQTTEPLKLKIGDPSIDGSNIKPYVSKWRITHLKQDGSKQVTETSGDEMIATTLNGRAVLKEIQRPLSGTQHGIYINVVDAKTLAPILSQQMDDKDGSFVLTEYKDGQVDVTCSGKLCPRDLKAALGEIARKSVKVETQVFDFWGGFYGMLLAGLPLKDGYAATLPAYHPVRGLISLRVNVEGEEMIDNGAGRQVKAWKVRLPQTPFVFYISKESPYWVKLIETRPDGNTFIYDRF